MGLASAFPLRARTAVQPALAARADRFNIELIADALRLAAHLFGTRAQEEGARGGRAQSSP